MMGVSATGDQFCMESSNTNNAILGVDVGNRLDHDAVIQLVLDAEAKFGQMAGGVAFIYASQTMARTNPHAEPIGALGNPNIETLVCANLHDAQTYYIWSNHMHQAFPAGLILCLLRV